MTTQWTRYVYNASPTYFKCFLKVSPMYPYNSAELINCYCFWTLLMLNIIFVLVNSWIWKGT